MHIVHVFIHVKEDQVEEFKTATLQNAQSSLKEPGVARFDLIQQPDDPNSFCAGRGLSNAGGRRGTQSNGAL